MSNGQLHDLKDFQACPSDNMHVMYMCHCSGGLSNRCKKLMCLAKGPRHREDAHKSERECIWEGNMTARHAYAKGFLASHSTDSLQKCCFTMLSYNAKYTLLHHAPVHPLSSIVLRCLTYTQDLLQFIRLPQGLAATGAP